MTREEHIAWCKKRAIEEMNYSNDLSQGIISMMSDLRKHPETNKESLITLCTVMLLKGFKSKQEAIKFINGFN